MNKLDVLNPADEPYTATELKEDKDFFTKKLVMGEREGFIWQKLNEPRSYDFRKTAMKGYNDKLRMPKFTFNQDPKKQEQAIESVMTFILGLVSEPPAPQYIYNPTGRQKTINNGRLVLEKYNCAGCHMLGLERWDVNFAAGQLGQKIDKPGYPFEKVIPTAQQLKTSTTKNPRGNFHASLVGLATRDPATGQLAVLNEDRVAYDPSDAENKPHYEITLYQPAVLAGEVRNASEKILVPASALAQRDESGTHPQVWGAWGGDLAKNIYASVLADEKKINPNANAAETWGWLPPNLANEGQKVQTAWLHKFLLEPYAIRPAVVLRMPKFNMSSAEAQALAEYFAAVNNVPTLEPASATSTAYLNEALAAHPQHYDEAMKIVTSNNYCVKCHHVGDFAPQGNPKGHGPQLSQVSDRLRPDYLKRWIANPQAILPYTGMPRNIEIDNPSKEVNFPGTTTPQEQAQAQLQGLVDLLMNYNDIAKSKYSVKEMVKPAAPVPPAK